jgi:LemA protein
MNTFDEKLNTHIDKVIALQRSQQDKMLSVEELKELDMSMGITEEEWNQMMQKADKDTDLAQNHFYYKNYRDAYKTAESAVQVNPWLTKALILMADCALKIYETEDDDVFLEKAEQHAQDILKQAPAEKRAVEILAVLNNYKNAEKNQRQKLYKIIGGIALVVIIICVFVFWPHSEKPPKVNTKLKYELIDAEENANAQWAQVENVISRRDKLIPQLFQLVGTEDQAVNDLKKEIEDMKQKITTADKDKQIELQAEMQTKFENLTKLINSKNNSESVKTLLNQVEGSYNRIAVEGKRYNDEVKEYNILVKKHQNELPEFKLKPYFQGQ